MMVVIVESGFVHTKVTKYILPFPSAHLLNVDTSECKSLLAG